MLLNLSLFWLIASASLVVLVTVPPEHSKHHSHTQCWPYWKNLQHVHPHRSVGWQAKPKLLKGHRNSQIPLFKTRKGSETVGGDTVAVCGAAYTDQSISACLWDGGIHGELKSEKPGWLSDSHNEKNCNKTLLVQAVHSKNPDDLVPVKVVDGCSMFLPPSDPIDGCKELWLTQGAFDAIGATSRDTANNDLTLFWTFKHEPNWSHVFKKSMVNFLSCFAKKRKWSWKKKKRKRKKFEHIGRLTVWDS